MTEQAPTNTRTSRIRVVLGVTLVVLILMLVGIGYFFIRTLSPARKANETARTAPTDLQWIRSLYGFGPSADEQLRGPTSVAISPNGTIFVTDPQRARIMAFNPNGTFARLIHTGRGGSGKGMLGRPESLAEDAAGNLYVSDSMNRKIIVFGPDGKFLREWDASGVMGIDVQGDSVLALMDGKVVTFTLQGERVGEMGHRGRGLGDGLDAAYGVTSDGKTIFVPDTRNRSVKAFTKMGGLLWVQSGQVAGKPATATEESQDLLQLPQDVAIDGAGRLVVVDAFTFKMLVIDAQSGRITKSYGEDGASEGQFYYPTGIAYDKTRDWFAVADTENNRVQIVRIPNSGGGLVQATRRTLDSPLRMCALPLALLLAALVILIIMSNRARDDSRKTQNAAA